MQIRYITAACSLIIVVLGMLTLAFSTHARRAFRPMQSSSPINVALATNGAVASASSVHFSGNFPVAAVNDGDRKAMNWGSGGGWNDNTQGDYSNDIVQISFPAFNFVSQINVFSLRDSFPDNQTPPTLSETFFTCENTGFGITEFEVQYWNGWMWITVPGGLVRDNDKAWRQFTFPEVWASGVRVQVHGAARFTTIAINYSRIVEIEAFGRTTGFNLAAAANGAVASASSTVNTNYPVSAVNDGDRTGFNWGRGGFGSGWRDATENEYSIDWVRIDFAGGQTRRINEIDVYTLRDGFSTKPDDPTIFETFPTATDSGGYGITDYDVQYLSGGVWRNVPGGKVTNNNKVRRQFRFAPITTNAIRVAVHKGVNYTTSDLNWSRIVEIEAWENAAAPDDVVWVEDALPAGAIPNGSFEGWNWTCFNPLPLSSTLAHTSEIIAGVHQHFFSNATQTLTVNAGDTLVAHVYLDPANPPTSVMLQWNDGWWEHRAYWGENQFPWGTDRTVSRQHMGALPPAGQWVRLEVPASLVGLEGRTLNGMAFSLVNGRATWDHAGKYAGAALVQPTISISDASVNEGNSGTIPAAFNVTLSSTSTQTISVNYATANASASSSNDYVGVSGTLTFSPGQTSKPISIQVVGDTAGESNESFFVNLSNPGNATIADNQGVGTILNDDAPPSIANDVVWVEDALPAGAISEGSFEGWNWTSFNPSPLSGTLAHTSGIVAGVHQHYFYNATQTLTVNAGDTLMAHVYLDPANPPTSVMLQFNDGTWEHRAYWGANQFPWGADGTISRRSMGALPPTGQWVRLEVPASLVGLEGRTLNGMAFSLVNGQATWDHAGKYAGVAPVQPTIAINDVTVNEGNSGATSAVFNVTLSSTSTQTISVNYATANGTARSTSDYVGASGTVTFSPGQTSKPISIEVVGDTAGESNENFFINLSNPVNATLADGQGVGTILNDDGLSYFEIPVYFHVIQGTNGDGYVDESRLDAQINVLNSAFNGATVANVRFFFWKAGVTRDFNHDWFTMEHESSVEIEAKRVLRQGGPNALNFYTTRGGSPQGTPYHTGWAWFPEDYAANATNKCRDGVVVPFTTLPWDTTPNNPFNAGDLPVHEVGHWLGLYHTFLQSSSFQDVCPDVNDLVDDTPAHLMKLEEVGECPSNSPNTCLGPGEPGELKPDPIHNYMTDYSDECKSEFTRGQYERMAEQYRAYRLSSTPPTCPVATVAWVAPSEVTWGPPNTLTVAGYAVNGSGGVELWWRDVTEDPVLPIPPTFNRVEWQPTPDPTDHTWSNTIPSPNKWHTFEVFVRYSGYESRHFIYNGSTARYYELVAKHSGKCLDVEEESTASGARVIQFGCGGWANQQWRIIPIDSRYNKIVARHSGKVLDVQGGGLDDGTPIWQWDENGTVAQQWEIIDVGGGYYKIVARHSGKVLDVAGVSTADGARIHQWDYVGGSNQQWLLRLVP